MAWHGRDFQTTDDKRAERTRTRPVHGWKSGNITPAEPRREAESKASRQHASTAHTHINLEKKELASPVQCTAAASAR